MVRINLKKRFVEEKIAGKISRDRFGNPIIKIPNARLDFSSEFVFKGVTKSGNVKLGDIVQSGPAGIKTKGVRGILRTDRRGKPFITVGSGTGTGILDL